MQLERHILHRHQVTAPLNIRLQPTAVGAIMSGRGGGVIGAGEHESVRRTHPALFKEAEAQLGAFGPAKDTELPAVGRVRLYLRTFGGTLSAEADEEELGHMRHQLSALFHSAHATITAIREATWCVTSNKRFLRGRGSTRSHGPGVQASRCVLTTRSRIKSPRCSDRWLASRTAWTYSPS